MGQVEDNDFTIKGHGTIVRDSSSPKINQMKKKLTANTNRSTQSKENSSSKKSDILFFLGFIFTLGCMVFGAIRQYDYTEGNILVTIVTAILCGALGWICVSVVFFVFSFLFTFIKK